MLMASPQVADEGCALPTAHVGVTVVSSRLFRSRNLDVPYVSNAGEYWSSLACVVVAGCLILGSSASGLASTHKEVNALRDDYRKTVISDHLAVNLDASLRYVYPQKCQVDGEIELTALSSISVLEESFIFIPSLCLWVESGFNESENSVSLDEELLYAIARQYGDIAIYHIQPGRRSSVANYFPAYRDFISMVLIDTRFLDEPNVGIKHLAITEYAVIEYRFSDWSGVQDRARLYEKKGLRNHISQNLAYDFNRQRYLSDYVLKIALCVDQVKDRPSRIGECRRVATDIFVLDIRVVQLVEQ